MGNDLPAGWRWYLSALGGLAALCVAAVAVWLALAQRPQPAPAAYLLKDDGGRLALYAADGSGPLAEYDVYTRLLPEQDVLALQNGISVHSADELQRRLEDYGI